MKLLLTLLCLCFLIAGCGKETETPNAYTKKAQGTRSRGVTYHSWVGEYTAQFPDEWKKGDDDTSVVWRAAMSRDVISPREWREPDSEHTESCPQCWEYYENCEVIAYKKSDSVWAWITVKCPNDGEEFKVFEQLTQLIRMKEVK